MKFKVTVIAILAAILAVNTAGILNIVENSQRQTEIALKTAELEAIQACLSGTDMLVNYGNVNIGVKDFVADSVNENLDKITDICINIGIPIPSRNIRR